MRSDADPAKIERFMVELGRRVRGEGTVYLVGGATALLYGWRSSTVDIDLKADPEPAGLFEAIAQLKEELDVNVELASPDLFIPIPGGWRERSPLIARHGMVSFHHFDPYSQTLAKLQRRHERDLRDARAMVASGLVDPGLLRQQFAGIEAALIRYPGVDSDAFRQSVHAFVDDAERRIR